MRNIFLLALAATLLAVAGPRHSAAAQAPTVTAGASVADSSPFAGLSLTAEQRARLKALSLATQASRRAILQRQVNGTALSAPDRAELSRLARAHNAAVQAILTPGQRNGLEASVARRARVEHERRTAAMRAASGRAR